MKALLIILSVFYFTISACSNKRTEEATEPTANYVIDTAKIAAIDTLAFKIDTQWSEKAPYFHKAYANERDTIKYIELNGEPQRISAIFFTDTTLTWVTFHQVNDQLKLVRFREKRDKPQASVKECLSYFENGKIFYTKERSKNLEEGEQIGSFRSLPFVDNARSFKAVKAEYEPYWEITKKSIEEARKKE